MKTFLLSCFFLTFCGMPLAFAQAFNVVAIEVPVDTGVSSAVFYRGHIYGMLEDGRLFKADTSTRIIEEIRAPPKLISLFTREDSLFAWGDWNSLYYFNGQRFVWLRKGREWDKLLEDARYTVYASCSGEWGGSVYFADKRTGTVHAASATCPQAVFTTDSGYLVLATLSHMMGSFEVILIANPRALKPYSSPPKRENRVAYVGENETHSRQGITRIAQFQGVVLIGAWLSGGKLTYIVDQQNGVFLCRLQDGQFTRLQQLLDDGLHYPRGFQYFTNDTFFGFARNTASGTAIIASERSLWLYNFVPRRETTVTP
ncbi:hypothetical protein ACWKWU_16615 [Chitinophaga lutea]